MILRHMKQFRRWLKFALSAKTRNRSRAQKAAWARRKITAAQACDIWENGKGPNDVLDRMDALDADKTIAPKVYGEPTIYTDRNGISRVRKQEE